MYQKKLENVRSLAAPERYAYFVRKVADFEEVWGLFAGGWATATDADGRKVLPFWPEEPFAKSCADGPWSGYMPRAIALHDFMDKWLPGMQKDEIMIGVFPTPAEKGVVVSPHVLADDLIEEMRQYE
jgi:Protein of unknown function (DUF2750)